SPPGCSRFRPRSRWPAHSSGCSDTSFRPWARPGCQARPGTVRMVATRIELPDDHGLIAGFVFAPQEPPQRLGWPEVRVLPKVAHGNLVWLHFKLTDVRACEWISQGGVLPAAAAEFLLQVDSRIRLDRLGGGIAGVLRDLHHDFDQDPESLGVIRF